VEQKKSALNVCYLTTLLIVEVIYIASVVDESVIMEHRCNDTDRGKKQNDLEKKKSHCKFVHKNSHIKRSGIEAGLPR
jgi:hypothetical protein